MLVQSMLSHLLSRFPKSELFTGVFFHNSFIYKYHWSKLGMISKPIVLSAVAIAAVAFVFAAAPIMADVMRASNSTKYRQPKATVALT